MQAHTNFKILGFALAENSTSLPYLPIPHITSLHNSLEFSQRSLTLTSGYANTENVYSMRPWSTQVCDALGPRLFRK